LRGGPLFFPYLGSGWGHGPLVELMDGSVKYDMISGIGPHFWGHSHPDITKVAIDAALTDTIMQGHLQQNMDALQLSKLLVHSSGLEHCFLTSSGAMANENGLKLAFQKKHPANRILAFDKCFMGRTIAMAQITDKPSFREGLPLPLSVDYIPFYDESEPEKSTKKTLDSLKNHLKRYPKQHAVMCFELVQGEAGFYAGTAEFFKSIIEILKNEGIIVLVDEIQTFGRMPSLFAFHYYQLKELVDIVTIGKLSQVCATLFKKDMKPKPGLLSQTFTSSTIALQASYWMIKHLLAGNYYGEKGKLMTLFKRFVSHFDRLQERCPNLIRGPYGIGGMIAFTPYNGEEQKVKKFLQELFNAGVIAFIAGNEPARVRFLIPAGAMTINDVDEVMMIIEKVLTKS
jgi:4-aminobutyrate aminotransferase-like enzyme